MQKFFLKIHVADFSNGNSSGLLNMKFLFQKIQNKNQIYVLIDIVLKVNFCCKTALIRLVPNYLNGALGSSTKSCTYRIHTWASSYCLPFQTLRTWVSDGVLFAKRIKIRK